MEINKQTKWHLLELQRSEWWKILQLALQGVIEGIRDALEIEEDNRKYLKLQGKVEWLRDLLVTPEQVINKISIIEAQQLNQEDSE